MSREHQRPRWVVLVPVLGLGLVLLGSVGTALRSGALLVHQCVAGDGLAGMVGLRLALLRPDPVCPSGELAVGGSGHPVIGVAVIVALPVLAVHVVAAGAALGLLGWWNRAVRGALEVFRAAFARALRAPVTPARHEHAARWVAPADGTALVVGRWHRRRGPPVAAFA